MPIPAIIAAILAALKGAGAAAGGAGGISKAAETVAKTGGGGGASMAVGQQQPRAQSSSIEELFSSVGNAAGGMVDTAGKAAGGIVNTAGNVAGSAMKFLGFPDMDAEYQYPAHTFQGNRQRQLNQRERQLQSLLETQKGQRLLNAARTAWYESNKDIDPRYEKIKMLSTALGSVLDPELEENFKSKIQSLLHEITTEEQNLPTSKTDYRQYLEGDQSLKAAGGRKSLPEAQKEKDYRRFFENGGEYETFKELGAPAEDYLFQGSTPDFPQSNVPKTYEQIGITNVDAQATLQEMQNALPEVDMKDEYELDPEFMKQLIELWKAKKLNKSNIHKAFNIIQQKAKQALTAPELFWGLR